jgi:hypothetical protein
VGSDVVDADPGSSVCVWHQLCEHPLKLKTELYFYRDPELKRKSRPWLERL